jgi:hypothetical protein
MASFTKRAWMGILLSVVAAAAFGDDRVAIKGYYKEDGTYVKPRVVDPISRAPEAPPPLPMDPSRRRDALQDYYRGKVVKAKVSLPACRAGLLLYPDDLGKTNVDLFRKVGKYGASIEKDANAVITDVRIKPRCIDIELNNGGYGDAGDVALRALEGIGTLGISEIVDHRTIRFQRGSRVRIIARPHDRSRFSPGDANVDEFKSVLKTEGKANHLLLEAVGLDKDRLDLLTDAKLLAGLNDLLVLPDLREKADLKDVRLSRKAARLMKKASTKKGISDRKRRVLNRELLLALYPQGIRKARGEFDAANLDFKKMDGYLSVLFVSPPEALPADKDVRRDAP